MSFCNEAMRLNRWMRWPWVACWKGSTNVNGVIRVNVQLVDGRSGATKWAQRYDLRSSNILSFEDQIATKVVDGLQVRISATEQKAFQQPSTTSTEAYDHYLQARFYWNEYFVHSNSGSLDKGEKLLVRAIALDSNFADAYALLADFYAWHSANFVENSGENLKHCEVAALNALRINPQSLSRARRRLQRGRS